MKNTIVSKENNKAIFTMEFTADEFEQAVIDVYKKNKDKFTIDGFRKGKAPRSIIEKHYGEGIFYEDAINNLLEAAYPAALRELELDVIARPALEFSPMGKGKDLKITANVDLVPTIEPKDYKGVEVEEKISKVDKETVDSQLEGMRKRNARIVSVDRAAQNGDTVILDYSGFVGDEQFEGGTAESQELKLGSGTFIPGFEEQLVGVKAGEKKDVNVTFPENYHPPLAGKDAVFHCLVHEVKEEQLPELDDDFAMEVSEFDTLDELRKDTEATLLKQMEEQAKEMAKAAVIKKVTEANEVDAPDSMVEDDIDRSIMEINQQLAYQGLGVEQYLQFMGKTMQDMRDELRQQAEDQVRSRIVLGSIIEKEGISVSQDDIDAELAKLAEVYRKKPEEVLDMLGEENLPYFKKDLAMKKAIDFLYDNAKVSMVEETKEEKEMREEMEKAKAAASEKAQENKAEDEKEEK